MAIRPTVLVILLSHIIPGGFAWSYDHVTRAAPEDGTYVQRGGLGGDYYDDSGLRSGNSWWEFNYGDGPVKSGLQPKHDFGKSTDYDIIDVDPGLIDISPKSGHTSGWKNGGAVYYATRQPLDGTYEAIADDDYHPDGGRTIKVSGLKWDYENDYTRKRRRKRSLSHGYHYTDGAVFGSDRSDSYVTHGTYSSGGHGTYAHVGGMRSAGGVVGGFNGMNEMKLDIVLYIVLDSSTDTGADAFDLVKQMLKVLATSYEAGEGGLKLYVLLHRNGRTRIIKYIHPSERAMFIHNIDAIQYTASPSNVVAIFQGLANMIQTFGSGTMQAKAIVLIGGFRMPVGAQGFLMPAITIIRRAGIAVSFFSIGDTRTPSSWTRLIPGATIKYGGDSLSIAAMTGNVGRQLSHEKVKVVIRNGMIQRLEEDCPTGTVPAHGVWCRIEDVDALREYLLVRFNIRIKIKKIVKQNISILPGTEKANIQIRNGLLLKIRGGCPPGTTDLDGGRYCKIIDAMQLRAYLTRRYRVNLNLRLLRKPQVFVKVTKAAPTVHLKVRKGQVNVHPVCSDGQVPFGRYCINIKNIHVTANVPQEHKYTFKHTGGQVYVRPSYRIDLKFKTTPIPPCDCEEVVWVGRRCPKNFNLHVQTVQPSENLPRALTDLTLSRDRSTYGMYQVGHTVDFISLPRSTSWMPPVHAPVSRRVWRIPSLNKGANENGAPSSNKRAADDAAEHSFTDHDTHIEAHPTHEHDHEDTIAAPSLNKLTNQSQKNQSVATRDSEHDFSTHEEHVEAHPIHDHDHVSTTSSSTSIPSTPTTSSSSTTSTTPTPTTPAAKSRPKRAVYNYIKMLKTRLRDRRGGYIDGRCVCRKVLKIRLCARAPTPPPPQRTIIHDVQPIILRPIIHRDEHVVVHDVHPVTEIHLRGHHQHRHHHHRHGHLRVPFGPEMLHRQRTVMRNPFLHTPILPMMNNGHHVTPVFPDPRAAGYAHAHVTGSRPHAFDGYHGGYHGHYHGIGTQASDAIHHANEVAAQMNHDMDRANHVSGDHGTNYAHGHGFSAAGGVRGTAHAGFHGRVVPIEQPRLHSPGTSFGHQVPFYSDRADQHPAFNAVVDSNHGVVGNHGSSVETIRQEINVGNAGLRGRHHGDALDALHDVIHSTHHHDHHHGLADMLETHTDHDGDSAFGELTHIGENHHRHMALLEHVLHSIDHPEKK